MPGSGKTTIGKLLGKKMGYSFMDTDDLIEKKEQITIGQVFKEKGEDYFRQKEKQVIDELKNVTKAVIATGGGMPVFFDNLLRLKELGVVIYLRVPIEELDGRTSTNFNRPLLVEDRRKKLEDIIGFRHFYYEKADMIIDNCLRSPEETCEIIANKIKEL